jgi:hypothetical protein
MTILILIILAAFALLVYSLRFFLIFTVMLIAGLTASVPLRRFLAARGRVRSGGGVVTMTFWGSIVSLFLSTFLLVFFYHFNTELLSGTESTIFVAAIVIFFVAIAAVTLIASFIIAIFILIFLRSRTDFPRWTAVATTLSTTLSTALIIIYPTLSIVESPNIGYRTQPSPKTFDVSYNARVTIRGDIFEVEEEVYEIRPLTNHYTPLGVDAEWLASNGVSVKETYSFDLGNKEDRKLKGLMVTSKRMINAPRKSIGLLRHKIDLAPWDLRILAEDTRKPKNIPHSTEESRSRSVSLRETSRFNGQIEISMPSNSYLSSFPTGRLSNLPDRDNLTIHLSDRREHIELYYLTGLRIGIIRNFVRNTTYIDVMLKAIAFLFWPVLLLILGAGQRTFGDHVLNVFTKKSKRRSAGF